MFSGAFWRIYRINDFMVNSLDFKMTPSKPVASFREFWIKNKANEYTDDQFWATLEQEYDTDIHVIECSAFEIAQNAHIDSEAENVKLHEQIAELTKRNQELERKLDEANSLIMFDVNKASDGAAMNHANKLDKYRKALSMGGEIA